MAMLCCVVTTVGYPGACVLSAFRDGVARILRDVRGLVSGVLHSPGNGGTGALRAPFNAETFFRNSVVQKRRVLVDLYMPMWLGKRKRLWI